MDRPATARILLLNILSDYRASTAIRALAFLLAVCVVALSRWEHPEHVVLPMIGLFFCALTLYDLWQNANLLLRAKKRGIDPKSIRTFSSLLSVPKNKDSSF